MPSSKRSTGNLNIWTGASEVWAYTDKISNANVSTKRGNLDTIVQSANLIVYGNMFAQGGNIYADKIFADISGNIVVSGGVNYGVVYKNPLGDAAIASDYFIVDVPNVSANITGNLNVNGTGKGNILANNISANRVTVTFANLTSANIGTANITANGNITAGYIRAQGYLNTSGANVLYGNANVFNYLGSNSNIFLTIGIGNVTTSGFVTAGGNVAASYFIGNGSQLTGLPASYSNANVAAYLPTYTGNLISLAGNVTTTANISAAYVLGNGAFLTGITGGGGTNYSNANVANYLPVYNGSGLFSDIQTDNANITGQAIFSSVANLLIPGGSSGQALITDGTGNVSFQSVTATPGNNPGSFQYNYNGTALYGADDFVYDDTDPFAPNLRISNLSLNIFKGTGSTDDNQFSVRGNMALLTATVGNSEQLNTGVLSIGGLDKLNLDELQFSNQAGNIVIVSANNRQLTYSDTFANAYSNSNAVALMAEFTGDIIPNANATYSLGNATNQWANLWVANNTIYLGNVPLAIGAGNVLTVDGEPVLSNNSTIDIATTGNITAANIIVDTSIIGSGVASPAPSISGFDTISAAGNISANYFLGNGAFLTGTYGNAEVDAYLSSGTMAANIITSANITAQNFKGTSINLELISGSYQWTFDNTGNLLLPGNTFAFESSTGNLTAGNIQLTDRVAFGDGTYQTTAWTGVANNYVAIGTGAGGPTQSQTAVAIGVNAGNVAQDYYTVAIGIGAGRDSQLAGAVAIGAEAGGNSQGTNTIAIGYRAGRANQANNSIVLNSTGANLNNTTANSFVVAPVRNTTGNAGILQYNDGTKEVTYSTTVAGNITVNGTGGISVPNTPAFRVYGSGNTINLGTTINGTGNLTINNFAVDYNQGNYLNTSTGVFTAPVAGLYSVHLICRTSSINNATSQIAVVKNGNTSQQQVFWEVAANSTVGHLGVSTVSKLAQGDTLTCQVILGNVNFDQNDSYAVAFLG